MDLTRLRSALDLCEGPIFKETSSLCYCAEKSGVPNTMANGACAPRPVAGYLAKP